MALANETPFLHASLLESVLQAHLLVTSPHAKMKCLFLALNMLMSSNQSLKDDSDSRDGVIYKATIITLVRIVKLAITTKDLDQALLL